MAQHRAAIILTSHTQLGSTGRTTGFSLCDLTHPLYEFERASLPVDIFTVKGGAAVMDENSRDLSDPINRAYMDRRVFLHRLATTRAVADAAPEVYSAVILAGGQGALWDFPQNPALERFLKTIHGAGGVIGCIAQGAAALLNLTSADDIPVVKDREITGLTQAEVAALGLEDVLPLSIEQNLKALGAKFTSRPPWQKHVVADKHLISGQNSLSAQAVGEAVRYAFLRRNAGLSKEMW